MKESIWGYMILALGIVIIVVLLLVQRVTTTGEEDYYLVREILESSMIDAIDYGSYRLSGRIVMSAEKFEEVFIRRFAESVTNNREYKLEFYDIYEDPPKATVRVRTASGNYSVNSDTLNVSIDTLLSGILETKDTRTCEDVPEDTNTAPTIPVLPVFGSQGLRDTSF